MIETVAAERERLAAVDRMSETVIRLRRIRERVIPADQVADRLGPDVHHNSRRQGRTRP